MFVDFFSSCEFRPEVQNIPLISASTFFPSLLLSPCLQSPDDKKPKKYVKYCDIFQFIVSCFRLIWNLFEKVCKRKQEELNMIKPDLGIFLQINSVTTQGSIGDEQWQCFDFLMFLKLLGDEKFIKILHFETSFDHSVDR